MRRLLVMGCLAVMVISEVQGQKVNDYTPVVVLDPGHGGRDTGTSSRSGIQEKDLALEVARECLRINRDLFANSLDIHLTRYSDTLVSLADRTRLCEALNANAFLSIHLNHNPDPTRIGIEAYINSNGTTAGSHFHDDSRNFAQRLLQAFNEELSIPVKGPMTGDFQVLRGTDTLCPAILLELGFLSNKREASYLEDPTNKTALALIILETLQPIFHYDRNL